MKLGKNWKRIIAGFMACSMLFLSVDLSAMTINAKGSNKAEASFKMGYTDFQFVEIDKSDFEGEIYDYKEIASVQMYSEEAYDWMKFSTDYVYNQLDDEWKLVWNALNTMCIACIQSTETMHQSESEGVLYYHLDGITLPEDTTLEEMLAFLDFFMSSNPQYYFLSNMLLGDTFTKADDDSEEKTVYVSKIALCLYNAFGSGVARTEATEKFRNEIETVLELVDNIENATEWMKLKYIHDYVVRKVEYNHGVLEDGNISDEEDEEWLTQSAYSVLCDDREVTVCAGYAEALALLCNGLGLDTLSITSVDHMWNKVLVDGFWYNVDATWDDKGENASISYDYFCKSDDAYAKDVEQNVKSHTPMEYWMEYVPACKANLDAEGNFLFEVIEAKIQNNFYQTSTFIWEVVGSRADRYQIQVYNALNDQQIGETIYIEDGKQTWYQYDTSELAADTSIYYKITAYTGDVTGQDCVFTGAKISNTESVNRLQQPLNVDIKWHVFTDGAMKYLVINVDTADVDMTNMEKLVLWYATDCEAVKLKNFTLDMSDGISEFQYSFDGQGIPYDTVGYVYVTDINKNTAFQTQGFEVGGEYVVPELEIIEDQKLAINDRTVELEAVISDDSKMNNFNYTYQWYEAENENEKGIAIPDATDAKLVAQVGSFDEKYFYCEVTAEYLVKNTYVTTNGIGHTCVQGAMNDTEITYVAIPDQIYTGAEIKPNLVIMNNSGEALVLGEDYKVVYRNNINAGDASIDVEFIGDYVGLAEEPVVVNFKIVPKTASKDTLQFTDVVTGKTYIYNGSEYTPEMEVFDPEQKEKLVVNKDYTITYSGNVDAGTAAITLKFMGNYEKTVYINFEIQPKSADDVKISDIPNQTFTGQPIIPTLTVKDGDKTLVFEKDYIVTCTKNVHVGTADAIITFIGNYIGNKDIKFAIVPKDVNETGDGREVSITSIPDQEYTGKNVTPALDVVYRDGDYVTVLKQGTDYNVTYSDNIVRGTASVVLEFIGDFKGTKTTTFQIVPKKVENLTFEPIENVVYTGVEQTPALVIKNGDIILEEGKDYVVSYTNNVVVGTAQAIIVFSDFEGCVGNYTGSKTMEFTILPKQAEDCIVKFAIPNQIYSYTGGVIKPEVIVTDGEKVLEEGTDYTVTYDYDKNVGKKEIQVDFKGNYTGTAVVEFSVISKSITAADLIIDFIEDVQDFIYNGDEKRPEITIMDKSIRELLRAGVDYIVKFIDNIFAGIATIQIEFLDGGNYIGKTILNFFTISARTTEYVEISDIQPQRYTGNAITPELEIVDTEANITLVKGTDYTVEYKNNIKEGTATAVVTFKGNFTGEPMSKTFTIINPVPTSITSSTFSVNQSTGYISKVTVDTTVNTLRSSLNERDYVVIYDKNGNVVSGTTVLTTGMTAVIMDEGTSTKKYTVVVTGDTNGDGKINITDMIAVKACTLKKSGLSGAYEKAGDVNGDGKINITDFIKVKATTLKKDTITGVEVK